MYNKTQTKSEISLYFSEDEISLNKGVWVNVLQKKADGWWLVQYEKQRGWFPSNYLIEVKKKLKFPFFIIFFLENK